MVDAHRLLIIHPSHGRLQKGSDEEGIKTQLAPTLKRSGNKIT
jgi:hypothetical protein